MDSNGCMRTYYSNPSNYLEDTNTHYESTRHDRRAAHFRRVYMHNSPSGQRSVNGRKNERK